MRSQALRSILASVIMCAACGPRSTTTSVAPTTIQASRAITEPTGLPDGPPLVTPGERMVYRMSLQGVELAAFTFVVDKVSVIDGKQAIAVQSHAKSVGLANMVAAIDNRFTSWLDVTTGRSLRFQVDEHATKSKTTIEHSFIDLAGRAGDRVDVSFALGDGPKSVEPQAVSQDEIWDFNSFLVGLRAWEGPTGTAAKLECFRSRFLWNIDVKIGAKEKLVTELGELPALRFEATTYRLDRKGGRDPTSEQRNFTLWISDDDGRVPLQIVAKTDYGDVKMQIVEYDAGTGNRLRE